MCLFEIFRSSRVLDEYEWPASQSALSKLDIVLIVLGVLILLVGVWSIRSKMMANREDEDDSYRLQNEDSDDEDSDEY